MIDSHAHIGKFKEWNILIDELYRQMNRHGFTGAIVSDLAGNEFDYEHTRMNNQSACEIGRKTLQEIMRYRDRFRMLFWIRPYSETEVGEVEDFICKYRTFIVGLKVHPYTSGVKLNDHRYEKYLKLCERYQLPFCVHTENDGYSDIDFVRKLAEKYPKIRFVAVHMGLRTDHTEAFRYVKELDNLYGDTTLVSDEDVLKAIRICGEDKILFGSDAPVLGEDSYARYNSLKRNITETFGVKAADKVYKQNCLKLFQLDKMEI